MKEQMIRIFREQGFRIIEENEHDFTVMQGNSYTIRVYEDSEHFNLYLLTLIGKSLVDEDKAACWYAANRCNKLLPFMKFYFDEEGQLALRVEQFLFSKAASDAEMTRFLKMAWKGIDYSLHMFMKFRSIYMSDPETQASNQAPPQAQ